jgi:lipoate-protein ligase A
MQTWRFIDSGPKRASLNMAIDEAIAESVGKGLAPPTLRFYGWNPPAVSIGYSQNIEEVDQEECRLKNYDIVRRPTGGRAILHNKELTYSIMSPADNPLFSKNIMSSYKILHQGIMIGLRKLGLIPEMVSGRDKKGNKSPACFFSPSIYELTIDGKKIIGSAQKRWQKVMLQQGSILLDLDVDALFSVLSNQNSRGAKERAGQKMTSISRELGKSVDIDNVKKVMTDGFEEALGIRLKRGSLTDYETALAFRLSVEKYSNKEWNYKK